MGKVKFRCPVQILNTEHFHGTIPKSQFDSWASVKKSLKDGKYPEQQENIIVNRIGHLVQTDFALVAAWELCALHGIFPKAFVSEAYRLQIALMLTFLARLDGHSYFDGKTQMEHVSAMEKEWL